MVKSVEIALYDDTDKPCNQVALTPKWYKVKMFVKRLACEGRILILLKKFFEDEE